MSDIGVSEAVSKTGRPEVFGDRLLNQVARLWGKPNASKRTKQIEDITIRRVIARKLCELKPRTDHGRKIIHDLRRRLER
jgi:hypothetical protein